MNDTMNVIMQYAYEYTECLYVLSVWADWCKGYLPTLEHMLLLENPPHLYKYQGGSFTLVDSDKTAVLG